MRILPTFCCMLLLAQVSPAAGQTRREPPRPAAPATQAPPPAVGVVEGDVFLRLQDGTTRQMPGGLVYLIPGAVRTALAPLCTDLDSTRSQYRRLRRPIRVAYDSARRARGRTQATWRARADSAAAVAAAALPPVKQVEAAILERLHAQRATQTGTTGHFTFDSVAPGEYALLSDADSAYFWFAPVRVAAGRQTLDLDNSNFFSVDLDRASSITVAVCTLASKAAGGDVATEGRSTQEGPALINRTTVRDELLRRSPQAFRGVSATVRVRFRILEDGSVDPETVEAVGSSLPPSLRAEVEAAAEMVAETMRFTPGMVDGRPVRVWVTQPISFH